MNTIYFATFGGASGTVWLWNCLLELGIRVDADPNFTFDFDHAIDGSRSRFVRHPGYDHFLVQLPFLTFRSEWIFRNDVFVCMTNHQLPPREAAGAKVILLVRDPRDVLMSTRRREEAQTGQPRDFMACVQSHLPGWIEFHTQALTLPHVGVFRFEDYKLAPTQCLAEILDFCGIACEPAEITRAVEASSLEMAKRGEYAYLCSTPVGQRYYPSTFNQSGRYQKWRTLVGDDAVLDHIVAEARNVMRRLGYFDEAGTYQYPPLDAPAPVARVSPVRNVAVDPQRQTASAIESLERAQSLRRAGALGEALKEIDRALAIDPETLPLAKLKLDTLFAVIDAEPRYVEAYSGEATRTFYWCANRDAAVLATHGRLLMRLLHQLGETSQLSALLDDWDSYSKLGKTATPADDLAPENAASNVGAVREPPRHQAFRKT